MSLSTVPGFLVLQGTLPYFRYEPHQQPWITRKGSRHSPSLAVCLAKIWTKRWPLLHEVEMPALPCCTGEGGNLSEVWNPEILPEFAASWPALRIFNLPAQHKHMSQHLKISICSLSLSPSKKIHIHTKRNIWIYFYWFCFSQELWLIHLVKGNRWRECVLSVCFPILSSGSFLRERSASFSGLLFIFQFLIQTSCFYAWRNPVWQHTVLIQCTHSGACDSAVASKPCFSFFFVISVGEGHFSPSFPVTDRS